MTATGAEAASDRLRGRLDALGRASPELAQAAAVYGALLPLLCDADIGAAPAPLSREEVRERLGRGRHLLQGLELGVDAEAAQRLALRLVRALEGVRPSAAARRLRETLESGSLDVGSVLPDLAAGERAPVAAAARAQGLDPDLVWTIVHAAFRPALHAWRRALAPLAVDIPWLRDSCFVCGARAAIAELRADGARHLRCASCGADWQIRRLQCPSCGNEETASLSTFYEEGRRDTRRVEACDRCRRYLKVIAAAVPTPADELLLEDLATFGLDRAARDRGYDAGR